MPPKRPSTPKQVRSVKKSPVRKAGNGGKRSASTGSSGRFGGKTLLLVLSFMTVFLAGIGLHSLYQLYLTPSRKESMKQAQSPEKDQIKPPIGELVAIAPSLYFFQESSSADDVELIPVQRFTREQRVNLDRLLQALMRGPQRHELEKSIITALPPGLKLRQHRYILEKEELLLDFNSALVENGSRNILQSRFRQLVFTVTQIPGVKKVRIWIDGKPRDFISGDGIVLSGTLTRDSF